MKFHFLLIVFILLGPKNLLASEDLSHKHICHFKGGFIKGEYNETKSLATLYFDGDTEDVSINHIRGIDGLSILEYSNIQKSFNENNNKIEVDIEIEKPDGRSYLIIELVVFKKVGNNGLRELPKVISIPVGDPSDSQIENRASRLKTIHSMRGGTSGHHRVVHQLPLESR